jgi:hypothetical protein
LGKRKVIQRKHDSLIVKKGDMLNKSVASPRG